MVQEALTTMCGAVERGKRKHRRDRGTQRVVAVGRGKCTPAGQWGWNPGRSCPGDVGSWRDQPLPEAYRQRGGNRRKVSPSLSSTWEGSASIGICRVRLLGSELDGGCWGEGAVTWNLQINSKGRKHKKLATALCKSLTI